MQEYSFHYLYGQGVIITATMAARCKNGPLPSNISCSGNTTSGTSGSTESEMHQSYDWWGSNPPLPMVEGRSQPAITCMTWRGWPRRDTALWLALAAVAVAAARRQGRRRQQRRRRQRWPQQCQGEAAPVTSLGRWASWRGRSVRRHLSPL